jgi:hypothetical protein
MGPAINQTCAECTLKIRHGLRDSWLSDRQLGGGFGHATKLSDS